MKAIDKYILTQWLTASLQQQPQVKIEEKPIKTAKKKEYETIELSNVIELETPTTLVEEPENDDRRRYRRKLI